MNTDTVVPDDLFCDGGVIQVNPSPIGGTWAWCGIKGGKIVTKDSDFIPANGSTVSNNFTELWAAVAALESVPKDWDGILHTDSNVTRIRLTFGESFAGVPQELRMRILNLRRRRHWAVKLVAGHPTRKELEAGVRERNGLMTSKWNVWCDKECQRIAREVLEGQRK